MAKYDGSVRINTDIKTKEGELRLLALENRIKKTADKIAGLRSRMDVLKDAKIPTQEYKDISAQIAKANAEFDRLLEKQEQMHRTGKDHGAAWDELNRKMDEAGNTIRYAKGELQDLIDTGKAFTLGADTEEYARLGQQLRYAENEMYVLNQQHDVQEVKIGRLGNKYRELSAKAKSAFQSIGNVLKKANTAINAFGSRLKETARKHLPFFRKETERVKSSLSGFKGRIKSLALSLLIFNQISAGFRAASSAISAGFKNLYDDNERFKASMDSLKASLLTLQNAFAAAFRPIVDMAVPYIQKLVEWLTEAVNLAGQFMAALSGRRTYTRAIIQTAKASEDAAEAAEDETEAISRQLSPLDDLNNLTSENNKEKDKGKDDTGSGIGTMFEEVPIDSGILEMADKVKDILSKLFAPLKEAWNREGKFVMDSWKYALDEVWKLLKDIGRDFLTVWQQEGTIKIFENLLHIIGDIGLVIGHLARNFREAWNENETGLHILENIRDIIGVIVENVRKAADKTVEWADNLDFVPLLEAFERFTESLIPVADALSGILTDFYTQVLLPLGKWTIEKGLPELLDVFTAFNEKVDWDALRTRLSEFWDHLEPFAETTVGEGLIIFIERVSDALADFINSEAFDNFLTKIEEWMDSVTPEDVADGLEMIAGAMIVLKSALLGYSVLKGISSLGIFTTLSSAVSSAAGVITGGVGGITSSLMILGSMLSVIAAAVAGWNIGSWIAEKLGFDTMPFNETMQEIKNSFTDGSWKEALHLWGEDIKTAFEEVWESAERGWNGMWDAVKRGWDQTAEWIKGAVEKIKTVVESLKDSFNFWTGTAGGKLFGNGRSSGTGGTSRMTVQSPYAADSAYASLASMEIPAYATGQVIPRSMKQHLAILGDNSRETEIVSPLSTIKQANKESLLEVLSELGVSGGRSVGGNTYQFSVDGRVFFEIMQKYAEEFKKQSGGRPAFS